MRALFGLAALVLVVGACSETGEELVTGDSPEVRDDALLVSIEVGGGFVPEGYDFRQPANAVVYSDGTTFAPGAITLQYPGPAVMPVFTSGITTAQVEQIRDAADAAGLADDEEQDYGEPPIADAATTRITVVADGQAHVTSVYALGAPAGPPGPESERPQPESNDARRQAQEFVDLVSGLATSGDAKTYEPERYRVLPLQPERAPEPEASIEAQERDWPFEDVALTARECVAVTGENAAEFRELLREANEITRWRTPSGDVFVLAVRPLLPHESDCPDES